MMLLDRRAVVAFPVVSGPLHSLGEGFADRFHSWHGASGVRYVTSVFPAGAEVHTPAFETGVVLPVVREGRQRRVLGVVVLERGRDSRRALAPYAERADEWHVHLLAADRQMRADIASDLRAALARDRRARLA